MPTAFDFYTSLLRRGVAIQSREYEGGHVVIIRLRSGAVIRTTDTFLEEGNFFDWNMGEYAGGTCRTDADVTEAVEAVLRITVTGDPAYQTLLDAMPHPMQPIGFTVDGDIRFKANAIVRYLLELARARSITLNEISMMGYSNEDYTHFMQLIGYSVRGYGELSTSPPELVEAADTIAARLRGELVAPDLTDYRSVRVTQVSYHGPDTLRLETDTEGKLILTRTEGYWSLPSELAETVQQAVGASLSDYLNREGVSSIDELYGRLLNPPGPHPTLWDHLEGDVG